jgi:hypothetical protein
MCLKEVECPVITREFPHLIAKMQSKVVQSLVYIKGRGQIRAADSGQNSSRAFNWACSQHITSFRCLSPGMLQACVPLYCFIKGHFTATYQKWTRSSSVMSLAKKCKQGKEMAKIKCTASLSIYLSANNLTHSSASTYQIKAPPAINYGEKSECDLSAAGAWCQDRPRMSARAGF